MQKSTIMENYINLNLQLQKLYQIKKLNMSQYLASSEDISRRMCSLLNKKENLAYSLHQELTELVGLQKPSLAKLLIKPYQV